MRLSLKQLQDFTINAVVNPSASDDTYPIGSEWYNTITIPALLWKCIDNTPGNAIWQLQGSSTTFTLDPSATTLSSGLYNNFTTLYDTFKNVKGLKTIYFKDSNLGSYNIPQGIYDFKDTTFISVYDPEITTSVGSLNFNGDSTITNFPNLINIAINFNSTTNGHIFYDIQSEVLPISIFTSYLNSIKGYPFNIGAAGFLKINIENSYISGDSNTDTQIFNYEFGGGIVNIKSNIGFNNFSHRILKDSGGGTTFQYQVNGKNEFDTFTFSSAGQSDFTGDMLVWNTNVLSNAVVNPKGVEYSSYNAQVALTALFDNTKWVHYIEFMSSMPGSGLNINDKFLVESPATGFWAGKENYIAKWIGGDWLFIPPQPGMFVVDKSTTPPKTYYWDQVDSQWKIYGSNATNKILLSKPDQELWFPTYAAAIAAAVVGDTVTFYSDINNETVNLISGIPVNANWHSIINTSVSPAIYVQADGCKIYNVKQVSTWFGGAIGVNVSFGSIDLDCDEITSMGTGIKIEDSDIYIDRIKVRNIYGQSKAMHIIGYADVRLDIDEMSSSTDAIYYVSNILSGRIRKVIAPTILNIDSHSDPLNISLEIVDGTGNIVLLSNDTGSNHAFTLKNSLIRGRYVRINPDTMTSTKVKILNCIFITPLTDDFCLDGVAHEVTVINTFSNKPVNPDIIEKVGSVLVSGDLN